MTRATAALQADLKQHSEVFVNAQPHRACGAFVCNVYDKHRPLGKITETHHSSDHEGDRCTKIIYIRDLLKSYKNRLVNIRKNTTTHYWSKAGVDHNNHGGY